MSNIVTVKYVDLIVASFDRRAAYELDKNSDNDSMQKTLADMRKTVSHNAIASIMSVANVDADFINKSERVSARFNVYSAEKVINVAQSVARVRALNHYTRAILATCVKLAANDTLLTHDDAQSACSLSVKSKDAKREKLIVKYQKHVSKSTADTQSSSSINALQMYNVLIETRDASNVVCYRLNTECDASKALLAQVA
jgi:hypothetical protein